MLREVWETFVRDHVVAHVPDEMSACLDCDTVQCSTATTRPVPAA